MRTPPRVAYGSLPDNGEKNSSDFPPVADYQSGQEARPLVGCEAVQPTGLRGRKASSGRLARDSHQRLGGTWLHEFHVLEVMVRGEFFLA